MKVSILGVEFHSPNLGCGALSYSLCDILADIAKRHNQDAEITAFVINPEPVLQTSNYKLTCVKYHLKDMNFWKKAYQICKESDFIIDLSLGDSFADIYSASRFYKHSMLKLCAIFSGKPYVLGPQTYGPFHKFWTKQLAKYVLNKSELCFTRDKLSQKYIYDICKKEAVLTTDVAFSLNYEKQDKEMVEKIRIGINPSGLLWDGREFITTTTITLDYEKYIKQLLEFLFQSGKYEVHLIPHVFSADESSPENDYRVCKEINSVYPETIVAPLFSTPMEAKSYISGMDIFLGARMHATIAAFSSGVATIPFSYSRKFEGLFGDLNYPFVISATQISTEEALEKTKEWIANSDDLQKQVEYADKIIMQKKFNFVKELEKLIKE